MSQRTLATMSDRQPGGPATAMRCDAAEQGVPHPSNLLKTKRVDPQEPTPIRDASCPNYPSTTAATMYADLCGIEIPPPAPGHAAPHQHASAECLDTSALEAMCSSPSSAGSASTPWPPPCQQHSQAIYQQKQNLGIYADGHRYSNDDVMGDVEPPEGAAALKHCALDYLEPVERINYKQLNFTEFLGSGEFGNVCRGEYAGEEVAIKQLFWDSSTKPEVVIRDLTQEIDSFRHLRHKRLVRFVGACLELPNLCLVTEYMPGGSLYHLLHVRKLKLPLLHGINMCLQLADGVTYLHSQTPCVVHRDLKSHNVVLDLNLNLKVCDFGLTETMERTHISRSNNGGSPRYMAPELFDGKMKVTEKVDIWAMGCIFIEIFGGPLPYDGINALSELARLMIVGRKQPVIPKQVPELLKCILRSCHNFDQRLRPGSRQVFDRLQQSKKELRRLSLLGADNSVKR